MYIPHTQNEIESMLKEIGVKSIEDLFLDIPEKFRFPELKLPERLTEIEAKAQVNGLSLANETTQDLICFLGAGAYNHYSPAVVDSLIQRGEFLTAYTPYQPEVSQGTLQSIFEYQSLISALTGMDVCNASHYDGATATAEAAVLAYHHFRGKRKKVLVSPSLHPHYRETLITYMSGIEGMIIDGPDYLANPFSDPSELIPFLDLDTAVVIVQYPDFFGRIMDFASLSNAVHEVGAIMTVAVNPISLGLLKPPGEFGADIVVGEGQSLGIPLSFGGPYLGIFATKDAFMRKLAGRLVGETVDGKGNRGYVLTLTAREQHIRREKSTSNICTNQALMALASTIYLSVLGKAGLEQVAKLCYHKAHYAARKIGEIPGYRLVNKNPFFNEFTIECPIPVDAINSHLLDHGILGGYDLSLDYPSLQNHMLIAVTEMNSKEDIDSLVEVLYEVKNV